jgi:hypothetical protein
LRVSLAALRDAFIERTPRARVLHLLTQRLQQTRVLPRLLHEIANAATHRFDREIDRGPRGHDDDRQRRIERVDARDQVDAFAAARRVASVVEIHQHHVKLPLLDRFEHRRGRRNCLRLVAVVLQQQA